MNAPHVADAQAKRAIDAPADAPLLAITGSAASGKTETLARRFAALLARDPSIGVDATIVSAATPAGAAALAERIAALVPHARDGRYAGVTLDRLAFDILAEHATLTGLAYDLEAIDALDAEEIFARAIAPLFSADWSEYLGPEIDPEIPGLRAPDRFATAVLRLIRKLRDAQITPDEFLAAALRGATAFYSNPPNLSAPALLFATKDEHHPSLTVPASERERQRLRELDLAKIIAKLYRSYLDQLVGHGCLTGSDAVAEATRLLTEHPALARTYRRHFRLAFIDDVHDLRSGEFRLLQALFGTPLSGVTVAGDPDAATATFAGARPELVFRAAATTVALAGSLRVPAQSAALVRALLHPADAPAVPSGDVVRLHRASDRVAETAFVADSIAALIAAGTPAGAIALVHRSARCLADFEAALVDRNIPIALCGDAALFERHDTLDALAVLWATADPFQHAWLLRALQLPAVHLSDASLATLCGEPASAQALLFDLPPAPERNDGSRRWDRRRDLRLGTNVVRGDRDIDLPPDARARLEAFRARRATWQTMMLACGAARAARAIVTDAGTFVQQPGETAARARRRASVVARLLAVIDAYVARRPETDLAGALAYCERIAASDASPPFAGAADDAVAVGAIDAVKNRRFAHVFIVDVRAGSFPPYYAPDAFLFSPTWGMIPKDSVGDAVTSRTAKFTWYQHSAKLRENYAREDRRALAVAIARADASVTISASGRATRGIGAPEFLSELHAIRPALVDAPLPAPAAPLPDAHAGDAPAPTPAESVAEPRVVPAERLAALTRCSGCAMRPAAGAGGAGASLLAAHAPADPRVIERDVHFALAVGELTVIGSAGALIAHDGRAHVAIAAHDPALAALAIAALGERVADDAFFVADDGGVSGPIPLGHEHLEACRAAAIGSFRPASCPDHARSADNLTPG